MKQNRYDDEDFFSKYAAMPRSQQGLAAAAEWPALRALLPDLRDKRVLDLGCGYGWHCRYAREQGALSVIGVDLSEKMLARARELTLDAAIAYRRSAIEDIAFADESFDVVFSSLAFHYVERFDAVCAKLFAALASPGAFVFSVEHPLFTAREAQDWHSTPEREKLHWPVDDYFHEGVRHTKWLADDVIKYHRTVATTIDAVIDAGFRVARIVEPVPPAEWISERPELAHELRRPMMLIVSAVKDGKLPTP